MPASSPASSPSSSTSSAQTDFDPMKAVYAEVGLKHAIECTKSTCALESCKHLKGLLDHVSRCSKPQLAVEDIAQPQVNTACNTCLEYWDIVKLHAKKCKENDCPVSNCQLLRPSTLRKKLMSKKKSNGSSGASIQGGSDASSLAGSKAGSFVSESGSGTLPLKSPTSKSSPKKATSFENLNSLIVGSGSGSELPRIGSTPKGLKHTSSFISVGTNGENMVPILAADEAYTGTSVEDKAHENVYNPMYADDEMGEIPKAQRKWWLCFGST